MPAKTDGDPSNPAPDIFEEPAAAAASSTSACPDATSISRSAFAPPSLVTTTDVDKNLSYAASAAASASSSDAKIGAADADAGAVGVGAGAPAHPLSCHGKNSGRPEHRRDAGREPAGASIGHGVEPRTAIPALEALSTTDSTRARRAGVSS